MKMWLKYGLIVEEIYILGLLLFLIELGVEPSNYFSIVSLIFFFGENPVGLKWFGFLLLYFVIGAIIGFLVDKIENK